MLGSLDRKRPLVAKALRITLVFLLVFWSSFSVQSLVAFGSEGSGSPAPGSTLTTTDDDEPLEEDPDDPIGGVDEPEKTFVSVQVVWADSDDDAGDRPGGVTARLYADGRATGDTLRVTDDDGWLGVFEDLDATDEDGRAIGYTVSVDEVEGYNVPAVEPNGDNGFFATFVWIQDEPEEPEEPETTSVPVQVVWEDSDDEAGDRPSEVTAHLYADGEETGETLEVTADGGWQGVFEDLDVADESGVLIEYEVSVDPVEGYDEPAVEADGEGGFVATFVRTPGVDESERYDSGKHGDGTLANLDIWTAESEDADTVGEKLTSASQAAEGEEAAPIELDGRDDQAILVAVPFWKGDTYTEDEPPSMGSADFVEWEIAGDEGCVDVEENGGILTVRGAKQGEASITLRLKEDAQGLVDPAFYEEHPGESFEAELTVNVKVLAPYVSSIEIQRPDGTPCLSGEGEELVLTKDELKSYAFRAVVHTSIMDGNDPKEYADYEISKDQSLSEASEGLFEDVKWEVLDKDRNPVDPDVASITEGGVFTMAGDLQEVGYLYVECSSSQTLNGDPATYEVIISSGKEIIDPQGEPHPQETLHVASNARVAAPQSPSANPTAGSDGDEAAEGGSSSSGSAPSGTGSGASSGASGSSASTKPVVTSEPIDETYTPERLEALGYSTGTFEMRNTQGPLTVTGEGPNLVTILKDAGIGDTSVILSIDFFDYRGVKTTYSWDELTEGAAGSPLVAVRSYVHEGGNPAHAADDNDEPSENSGESADPGTAQTMLENTRFRVLTDASGAIDADALRYINEIHVNVEAGGGQQTDDDLKIRIDYKPVKYGNTALLTAIPSLEVSSARFNLSWQVSEDGTNWTDLHENGSQTLYVVTDDTTIGTYYRVLMETDMVDPETGGYRSAVSDPVEIKTVEEDDFYVQLAYTPPPAGKLAIFTANPHLAGRTIAEYVWEYSQDGGVTWNVIPGEKSPSFSVKTEPVSDEPSDDGEDPEPVVLTYVRVRVIATSGEVAVSNAIPLTVEVGGSGSGSGHGELPNMLIRLGGKTRYDTMKAIVEEAFPHTCKHVVLVSGANFPDALSAAALAGAYDCPVVTTKPNALSTQARAEIERLGAKSIIIVGGTSAVSKAVETTVKGLNGGTKVERISGSTRYDTALKVMNRVASLYPVDTVFIATGKNFPDALAVSPYSYAHGAPIVLVDPAKGMTNAQANAVVATGAKRAVLLGGKNVVPDSVAMKLFSRGVNEITRLAGSTRYATSIEIAKWATRNGSNLWSPVVTTGLKDADALVGAALAGRNDSVLLLADDKSGKDKATAVPALSFLANHVGEVDICYILGGENAVSRKTGRLLLRGEDGEVYSYPDESAILPAEPTLPTSLASAADDKRFAAAVIG